MTEERIFASSEIESAIATVKKGTKNIQRTHMIASPLTGDSVRSMNLLFTLVLATPISGPALIWTPQSVSRDIELPTVLVIPTVKAPLSLQYRRPIKVSAVSPENTDIYNAAFGIGYC